MSPVLKFATRWVVANGYHFFAALLIACLIGGAFAFTRTFLSGTNVMLGFCLLPFTIFCNGKNRINYAYLALMIFFGVIAAVYSVRMFYFFMLAFYFLVILECFIGKVNSLMLFLIAFMSPFFQQVSVILGFPIRLQLSQWAGNMLAIAGLDIQVEGNSMLMNGNVFEVDDACMGLSMLAISLLMGVAAIAHQYRLSGRRLKILHLVPFFMLILVLNVISNLFRIMLLVLFRVPAENVMHEVIGMACLVLYVMVPLYFLSQWIVRRFGQPVAEVGPAKPVGFLIKSLFVVFASAVITIGIHVDLQRSSTAQIAHADIEFPNVQSVKMEQGITKLFNTQMLMYIKPIPEFFTSEHTPLLCWKGSGYQFQRVRKTKISSNEIYMGQLVKPEGKLFTAWWYTNGQVITIDQWNWRLRMLKGEAKFSLINITADDEKTLVKNIRSIFDNNSLNLNHNSNVTL